MANHHRIVLEQGKKKTFASAIDWPGWSRSGKSDQDAIRVLVDYAERYQLVAVRAGVRGVRATADDPQIGEHLQGSGATDFGVPDKIAAVEYEFMTPSECDRQLSLLQACWETFDKTAERVSEELRKGPRGGGRNRAEIVNHTLEAERGYARQIGVKTPKGQIDSDEGLAAHRAAVVAAIREFNTTQAETKWPIRYFLRRAAWHLLDHAWEMEDKDLTGEQREG